MNAAAIWSVSPSKLSLPEKAVLAALLAEQATSSVHSVTPSINVLAWRTSQSERNVGRTLRALTREGYLIRTERDDFTPWNPKLGRFTYALNTYRLLRDGGNADQEMIQTLYSKRAEVRERVRAWRSRP